MKYTEDDIKYLVGQHLMLNREFFEQEKYEGLASEEDLQTVFTLEEGIVGSFSYYFMTWIDERGRKKQSSRYSVRDVVGNLNNGAWIVIDLPEIDFNQLRESEDEFGWARDILDRGIDLNNKAWHIMLDGSDEQFREAQEWLFSQGFTWPDGRMEIDEERIARSVQSLFKSDIENRSFTIEEWSDWDTHEEDIKSSRDIAKRYGYYHLLVLKWNDIKQLIS